MQSIELYETYGFNREEKVWVKVFNVGTKVKNRWQ